MNIKETIKDFFGEIEEDENHRYKSWEHCYNYFSLRDKKIDRDIACLHLAFYLASWGMYRGSTFLLQKDYLIHMPVVKIIMKIKDNLQNIDFSKLEERKLKEIIDFVKLIKKQYIDNIKILKGEKKEINVSDALASKILLGTLGCVPAYDTYFRDGLKKHFNNKYKGILTLNEKSLLKIIDFYKTHKIYFDKLQREIKEKTGIKYPAMKLVDMYFWNKGFKENSKQKTEETIEK